jgi:hypothetical protein
MKAYSPGQPHGVLATRHAFDTRSSFVPHSFTTFLPDPLLKLSAFPSL